MFCSNCGKELDSDARFCPNCGKEIKETEGEGNLQASEKTEVQENISAGDAKDKHAKIHSVINKVKTIFNTTKKRLIPLLVAEFICCAIFIYKAVDYKSMANYWWSKGYHSNSSAYVDIYGYSDAAKSDFAFANMKDREGNICIVFSVIFGVAFLSTGAFMIFKKEKVR